MQKEKFAFIGSEQAIRNAYSADVSQKLSELLTHTTESDTDIQYIFTTWGMPSFSEAEIEARFPNLKAVFYAAGSVQNFAKPFLHRGVKIFSAWGANAVPVAEMTVAEILLANKGFFHTVHRGGSPVWTEHDNAAPHPGNFQTPVGIIGVGMIGSLVIEKLKAFNLQIYVYDAFLTDEKAALLGVRKVPDIPSLFACCRVVSNHLANNPQTVGMIDRRAFERMDNNGVFLNTGRGAQVVEQDLIDALRAVPTRCAVLDVTNPEPPLQGSALYTLPNVFLTPHCAGSIGREVARMGDYMLADFLCLINGLPTSYSVTEEMLRTMA